MIKSYLKIRSSGGRMTRVRKAIIQILTENNCLLDKKTVLEKLSKKDIYPNRSTLYREFLYLVKKNIVLRNNISGTEYFEIQKSHHHHLICLNCNSIKHIEMRDHLKKQEKDLSKKNKFNIINHSLDFYGFCRQCQV